MDFTVKIPFAELLGFELIRFDAGEAEIAVPLRPELSNSFDVAHGGVTMTLLDVVMAHAARSPNQPGIVDASPGVVTVEMKTTFMRPAVGRLVATGRLLHRSAALAFCEASVHGDDGKLLAHATGTFKYMKALPAGGRQVKSLQHAEPTERQATD